MLTCTPNPVNETAGDLPGLLFRICGVTDRYFRRMLKQPDQQDPADLNLNLHRNLHERRMLVADVQIDDGIIKILSLEVQDPKAAAVLAEYPQVRWAEITRKAVKIGLGYLKGGERA